MNNREFVDKLYLGLEKPSQYATGAFGAVVNLYNNRERYMKNSSTFVANKIKSAPDGTFMYDCIGYGKAMIWGWDANPEMRYGGANYKNFGIPDFQIKKLEQYCDSWSEDGCENESLILPGEWLRTPAKDHVGYYVGNGYVLECTQAGDCKVREIPLHLREWEGHGTLQYIDYIYDTYNRETYTEAGTICCPGCGKKFNVYTKR